MDYDPRNKAMLHRRQEGSDCGQDMDLEKGLNQLNSFQVPTWRMQVGGVPFPPLLPPLGLYLCQTSSSAAFLHNSIMFSCIVISGACQALKSMMLRTETRLVPTLLLALQPNFLHSLFAQQRMEEKRERFKFQTQLSVNLRNKIRVLFFHGLRPQESLWFESSQRPFYPYLVSLSMCDDKA